jgi:hypothetical protein
MKTCKCGSSRILSVTGKTSDMCFVKYDSIEHDGYVPGGLNIGDGDYIEIDLCMDCGKVQGKFPVTDSKITHALRKG